MLRRVVCVAGLVCLCLFSVWFFVGNYASTNRVNKSLQAIPQDASQFVRSTSSLAHIPGKRFMQYYFAPWNDPYWFESEEGVREVEQRLIQRYLEKPGWGENKLPHATAWVQDIADNMSLHRFPNLRMRAITVRMTALRLFPTDKPSFTNFTDAGEGYPFDNLQSSTLDNNTPVYVLHMTRDGLWKLVMTPYKTYGWVRSEDLAYVDAAFVQRWEHAHYVVALSDKLLVFDQQMRIYFHGRIGELFPLQSVLPHTYQVGVAVSKQDGYAQIIALHVHKSSEQGLLSTPFPFALTQAYIAQQINRLMGEPYGWGGLYGYRDCSATMRALFAPFGIWLPRNSTDQSQVGAFVDVSGLSDQAKRQKIITQGKPFHTLLWLPGHITLYVGEKKHTPYIFHSMWGLHTYNYFTFREGRAIIGRAAITPLAIGHAYWNVHDGLLSHVQGLVNLAG